MKKHFLQNQQGSVLIITGLMVLVLFAAMGLSIDLGRQQMVRIKLQQATDAAALAAALLPNEASKTDRENTARRYYELNFPSKYLDVERPSLEIKSVTPNVELTATTLMAAWFVSNVGFKDMEATGHSIVASGGQAATSYDVLLVMDNSNSMAQTMVVPTGTTVQEVMPNDLSDARLQAQADCKSYYINFPPPITSRYNPMCDLGRNGDGVSSFAVRDKDYNPIDPYIYYGLTGNSRLNVLRGAASSFVQQILASSVDSRVGLVRYGSQVPDIGGTLDLTKDVQDLHQFINHMGAVGGTNSFDAFTHAVDLSNQFNNSHVRAVVFMTDGQNTQAGRRLSCLPGTLDPLYPTCKSMDDSPAKCDSDTPCPYTTQQSLPLCTQLKNDGVLIYTISFGAEATTGTQAANAEAFLRQCATLDNDTYFKKAANANDLNQAFSEIFTQLGKLRIVR